MQPKNIRIIGVHPLAISEKEFDDAIEWMWGSELDGEALEQARTHTRAHFEGLRLIEIEVTPPGADLDWGSITQPVAGEPRENWQAPYDEQLIDKTRGAWAFFLHGVDASQPLCTELGEHPLPATTPTPPHLAGMKYETP